MIPLHSTTLYHLWAEDGSLLYVGSTYNVERRVHQHRLTKPWADEIAYATAVRIAPGAYAAEQAQIRTAPGRYNANMSESARRGWGTRKAANARFHDAGVRCWDAGCASCRHLPRELPSSSPTATEGVAS